MQASFQLNPGGWRGGASDTGYPRDLEYDRCDENTCVDGDIHQPLPHPAVRRLANLVKDVHLWKHRGQPRKQDAGVAHPQRAGG